MSFNKKGLGDFEKKRFSLNTDEYIDMGIKAVLNSDKYVFEAGKSLHEGFALKIINIDQLENILLGMEIIKYGLNSGDEKELYQEALDSWREKNKKPKTYDSNKSDKIMYDLQYANYRFRMMMNSLKRKGNSFLELTLDSKDEEELNEKI